MGLKKFYTLLTSEQVFLDKKVYDFLLEAYDQGQLSVAAGRAKLPAGKWRNQIVFLFKWYRKYVNRGVQLHEFRSRGRCKDIRYTQYKREHVR